MEAVRALEVLENTSDAAALLDRQWRFLYVNSALEAMAGRGRAELLGGPFWEALPGAEEIPDKEDLMRSLRERGVRFETYVRPRDLWIEVNVHPTSEGIAVLLHDIGERKKAEREARGMAELLNGIGRMLLAERDPDKLLERVIAAATQATGAEVGCFFRRGLNGGNEPEVRFTPAGPRADAFSPGAGANAIFGSMLCGETATRSTDLSREFEYGPYFNTSSGAEPIRASLAAPIISPGGDVLGGLFLGHSEACHFSDRQQSVVQGIAAQAAIALDHARLLEQAEWAQGELKRSNEDLRRANKDLETFAYSASHDLQEPLRNVSLSAQLLQRALNDAAVPAETTKFLAGILKGAQRMENLVRDLLAYARATQQMGSPRTKVDANGVLAGVLMNLKSRIEQSGARVTSDPLPSLAIHQVHLAQLFQNLIGNALKYRSGENPAVHIAARREHGWWVFSVTDNGIGIDLRYGEQIFGLFKRLHTREEYPGSGIGLAICQRIVEQYSGRIWLERSTPGRGSVFCFSLPER
jgi:PAS domain S-box-containing protein